MLQCRFSFIIKKHLKHGVPIKDENEKIQLKKLTSDKIFDLNKTLRKFFNWTISQKYLDANPCSLNVIEIPGDGDGEEDEDDEGIDIQAFSDQETNIILNDLQYQEGQDNTFNVAVNLDFITGLRKGELLGIKKKFVDLKKCTIKVRNTLGLVKVFETPEKYTRVLKLKKVKTKTSKRTINFPKAYAKVLEKYFEEQEKNGKQMD